jgi:hypothetical protein
MGVKYDEKLRKRRPGWQENANRTDRNARKKRRRRSENTTGTAGKCHGSGGQVRRGSAENATGMREKPDRNATGERARGKEGPTKTEGKSDRSVR